MRAKKVVGAALIILLAAGGVVAVKVLTPANDPYKFSNGLFVQMISFERGRHEGTPYAAWTLNVLNGSDSSVRLVPTTRCWTGLPLRRTGVVPAIDEGGRVAVNVPADMSANLRGACVMPEDERRFFYSVRLSDDLGSGIAAPFVFHGKMPARLSAARPSSAPLIR